MALVKEDLAKFVELPRRGRIRYYEAGPADAHPVLLIHGSGPGATGWSNFSANIGPIAEKLRVLAIDLPGWGESAPTTWDTVDHPATIIEFMDALGIDKAALVGNSMGGHLSIVVAIEHPERVSHLITMGPPVGRGPFLFSAGDGPSEGLKVLIRAYEDPTPDNMMRLVEIMTFDKARFATPELAKARSDAALANPEHLRNYVEGRRHGFPITQWVDLSKAPGITAPTLLIHGRDDRVQSYESTLILLSLIPDSRAHIINHCGHWAMIEHPEEFNTQVIDFVSNY